MHFKKRFILCLIFVLFLYRICFQPENIMFLEIQRKFYFERSREIKVMRDSEEVLFREIPRKKYFERSRKINVLSYPEKN